MVKRHWFRSKRYLATRKWVDATLRSQHEELLLVICILPLLIPMLVKSSVSGLANMLVTLSSYIVAAFLWGFTGWRIYRLIKVANLQSARRYERKNRYMLSHEYHDATSAKLEKVRAERAKVGVRK